jgi:hypothetical protein
MVDSLALDTLLDEHSSGKLLAMMTDHTIYVEAYGKMWSTLAEVYPCLQVPAKKLLDGYLAYYSHCDHTHDSHLEACVQKRQRVALTSFLVHTMKYSAVSVEREELTCKIEFIVSRLGHLMEQEDGGGMDCDSGEFDALMTDLFIFVREGWEVLCREEVWPLCLQLMEKTLSLLTLQQTQASNKKKSKTRWQFKLEEVLADIKEQGRYHL